MTLTGHAKFRSRQRSIPYHILSMIYEFGSPRPSRGLTSLTLDRTAIEIAKAELPEKQATALERYSGCYLIVGEADQIVTVARRARRFRH